MRLYFSINGNSQLPDFIRFQRKFNLLISFKYEKGFNHDVLGSIIDKYFIFDSGAFTVWKTGGQVDINAYIEKIRELEGIYGDRLIAINLDVIPGKFGQRPSKANIEESCKASFENYQYIRSKTTCKIMPVFHQHDNWEWLDTYMKDDCFLLGISPANDCTTAQRIPWLNKVFSITRDKKRTHGLAVTSQKLIELYPFYSVDSASWTIAAGLGQQAIFKDGKLKSFHYKKKEHVIKHNRVGSCDVNGEHKYTQRRHDYIASFIKMEKHVTDLWSKRGIIWTD